MSDDIITKKMQITSLLKSYYAHSLQGYFIKEIVEIITQGRDWIHDFHELIDAHKYGYNIGDLPDRHHLSNKVFLKLLKSRVMEPVPWVNCYDPIWIAYLFRDVELTWMLLKYNVACVRKMEEIPKLRPLTPVIQKYLQFNTPNQIQEFLSKLVDYSCQSRRRLKVVLWGLDSICYKECRANRRYKVMCLKTFFEFIPEPSIASAEIGGVVKYILGNQSDSDDFVSEVCKTFEIHYPESIKPYQPRSLKHLSRCCILQTLRRIGRLPQGVDQLHLPQVLKGYILPKKCPFLSHSIYTEEDGLSEEREPPSDEEFHSDVDSEDMSYSSDSTLSADELELLEADPDYSKQLKINLRTRKFVITNDYELTRF